jgi:hypothetical protein
MTSDRSTIPPPKGPRRGRGYSDSGENRPVLPSEPILARTLAVPGKLVLTIGVGFGELTSAMASSYRVTTFVDWDTARRIVPWVGTSSYSISRHIETVFEALQDVIARYILSIDKKNRYRVNWRIYHGWYRGKTKTEDRSVFDKYVFSARSRTIRYILFGTDYAFGDVLCCNSYRNPIFDTLRQNPETEEPRQKMVDASLICDLLHLVRCRDSELYIVVANDDDFIPALFTAEAWRGKVILLHNRQNMNSHLRLNGIIEKMVLK